MVVVIPIAQVVCGVLWLLPMILFAPSFWRVWVGYPSALDVVLAPVVLIAVTQVGFSIRWLLYPYSLPLMRHDELLAWTGLYALSALCVVGLLLASWAVRGKR